MNKIYAVELSKCLQECGIASVDLELFFEISDIWAKEILKCEDIKRRCALIKFASYATQFLKQRYSEDKGKPYTLLEIQKMCGIKHLGVVLDLLSNGMIDRIPDDSIIEVINSATYDYQAKYALMIKLNPELQKLGLGKLAIPIILKASAAYKAKYETIAISCIPSMISLEGICYMNDANTEFQVKSILDILCNEKLIDRDLALFGARSISQAICEEQVIHIQNVICNFELGVEEIRQRVVAILRATCNWEMVTYAYTKLSKQPLPISAVLIYWNLKIF